jgi:alpha-beta hydrolase superfamily lysophospholipase
MRKNVEVSTNFYSSVSTRGVLIFIAGPEAKFQSSAEYLEELCKRGFSIAAFNLKGKKVRPKDYLWAARFVTHHVQMSFPHLLISLYGWSKGAEVAVQLASLSHVKFQNIILDSPTLKPAFQSVISTGQIRNVKIFACSTDRREPHRLLKKMSYGAKVFVTNHEECSHRLATSPEVEHKLVDFIETDFSNQNDSFWVKI